MENFSWKPEGERDVDTTPRGDSVFLNSGHASNDERDADQLARLGKKPVLKRSMGFYPMLGFSCTVLVTWEGILLTWQIAYSEAGPAGAIYAYLVVWFGTICTYLCMSELASMAPTSGGQYHWVSMMAPPSSQKFLSYITGWLTVTGWQATCASGAFNAGTFIQGLIVLCNPEYEPAGWRTTLLAFAVLAFAVFINVAATTSLAKFEGLILILHIIGFFAILIPLVYFAPHATGGDVFATFLNPSGWETQTYGFFVGLVGPVLGFVGGDCAVHMSEEIREASRVVPRAIMFSTIINGTLGFGMLVALLFSLGSASLVPSVILGTELGFPFIQVLLDATRNIAGTAVMSSIVLIMGISSTVGLLASASRLLWAFSRDRSMPFWSAISKVDSRTTIPVPAVLITTLISALLALIGIGSSVAFNDVISITTVGLYSSYIMPLALLLWRRTTGGISDGKTMGSPDGIVNTHGARLTWGPFAMPRALGVVVNAAALAYLVIVFLFAFWPTAQPVNAESMNYACLVWGTVILLSLVWYAVAARKVYTGPVVEVH